MQKALMCNWKKLQGSLARSVSADLFIYLAMLSSVPLFLTDFLIAPWIRSRLVSASGVHATSVLLLPPGGSY